MSPTTKFVIKCVLIGIGVLLSSLATATIDGALSLNEAIVALSFGWGAGLGYGGLGYVTTLEAPGRK